MNESKIINGNESLIAHEIIIGFVILAIIIFQLYFGWNTFKSIFQLRNVLPDIKSLRTKKTTDYDGEQITLIMHEKAGANIGETYETDTVDSEGGEPSYYSDDGTSGKIMDNILASINNYLKRNKGAVADFNLIKDITDRNIDALEEEISTMLPVPLYIGLAGTIGGIIIGLLFLPEAGGEDFLTGEGIDTLIGGVKIAMSSTLAGIILTIANSSISYKKSKVVLERRKNDFFSFLQTELLPILTENSASSIYALDRNLKGFNKQFKANTREFGLIMNSAGDSLKTQEKLFDKINNGGLQEMAKHNLELLNGFEKTSSSLERFKLYLDQINFITQNSTDLLEKTGRLLENSDNVGEIVEAIKTNVRESNQILKFLESHFSEIEKRNDMFLNTVSDIDSILIKSLESLQKSTDAAINKIHAITDTSLEEFQQFTKEKFEMLRNHTEEEIKQLEIIYQKKQSALEQLHSIPEILSSILEIKKAFDEQNQLTNTILTEIKQKSDEQHQGIMAILENINENISGLPSAIPLKIDIEREKEGKYIQISKSVFYISGAILFTGICIYTGVIIVSSVIQRIAVFFN